MKCYALTPLFQESFPRPLLEGVLYISERFHLAAHRCCCGCGEEVITPLSPAEWSIRRDDDLVSVFPSIGNWGLPCQSHYWILQNKVIWSRRMTPGQIEWAQARDLRDQVAQVTRINQLKDQGKGEAAYLVATGTFSETILGKLWRGIVRFFKNKTNRKDDPSS